MSEKVQEISCGVIHTLVLTSMNRILSCGYGGSFALGHGSQESLNQFKEIHSLRTLGKIKTIAAGMNHSGCVTSDGKVYMWGISGDAN